MSLKNDSNLYYAKLKDSLHYFLNGKNTTELGSEAAQRLVEISRNSTGGGIEWNRARGGIMRAIIKMISELLSLIVKVTVDLKDDIGPLIDTFCCCCPQRIKDNIFFIVKIISNIIFLQMLLF